MIKVRKLHNGLADRRDGPSEAKKYNRIKLMLSVISVVLGIGFLAVILLTGFSAALEKKIWDFTSQRWLGFLIFVHTLGFMETMITLPLGFYGGFVVEHQYKLSTQSFGRWCWEEFKGLLVGLVLLTPLLLLFYFFLIRYPSSWWIPVGVVFFMFSFLLAKLGPVLIFPLFYTFSPVSDESLKKRLQLISERVGLHVAGVFSFNLSKNTKKANAAFAGLGRTRRILLADTLLDNFTSDEIAAVTGHELGHYRYHHIWKTIFLGFVLTFGGLYLASFFYWITLPSFGGTRGDELAVLPLLALFLFGFGLITMPVQNLLSRRFERQADRFVAEEIGGSDALVSALDKLGELNKADREPHPVVEFLFYSHPSLKKRLDYIRSIQEQNNE